MRRVMVRGFDGARVRGFDGARVRRCEGATVTLRSATPTDAHTIHALIAEHVAEGHLLPRRLDEIAANAARFVVAADGDHIVGCADIAPLSAAVGEVRSLVIGEQARGLGIGRRLIHELVQRADSAGFASVCAFTSEPGFFVQMGFSIVPHSWLPEKLQADCATCSRFRSCGQYALMLPLVSSCRH